MSRTLSEADIQLAGAALRGRASTFVLSKPSLELVE